MAPRRRIPRPELPTEDRALRFSFKYLDLEHSKFRYADCPPEFLESVWHELKRLSGWPVSEFCRYQNERANHPIHFAETSEPDGFAGLDPEQLGYAEAWQFCPRPRTDWRIHGILIEDMFYLVWFDPHHRLYPKQNP